MRTAGIIAEYNPFHNGHSYQIEQTRAAGATHIAAVMSGNFVQRGEPALFSKWERAEAALRNGVDLVLELPVLYALGSAERFAAGAVAMLNALGCVELLSFGSECGDLSLLKQAADCCLKAEQGDQIKVLLKEGLSYPKARMLAVEEENPQAAALLKKPNNTLGVEYLKAISRQSAAFSCMTVLRKGADHDGMVPREDIASASCLRHWVREGRDITHYLPKQTGHYTAFADPKRLESAILWQLRQMGPADFQSLPDVTEGLEYRLYETAKNARSTAEFIEKVKTKRYTRTRLQRILWNAMLGVKKEDYLPPSYLRVLGFTPRGKEILKQAKLSAALPVMSRMTQIEHSFPRMAELEKRATDIWGLCVDPVWPCGQDYLHSIVRIEETDFQ